MRRKALMRKTTSYFLVMGEVRGRKNVFREGRVVVERED